MKKIFLFMLLPVLAFATQRTVSGNFSTAGIQSTDTVTVVKATVDACVSFKQLIFPAGKDTLLVSVYCVLPQIYCAAGAKVSIISTGEIWVSDAKCPIVMNGTGRLYLESGGGDGIMVLLTGDGRSYNLQTTDSIFFSGTARICANATNILDTIGQACLSSAGSILVGDGNEVVFNGTKLIQTGNINFLSGTLVILWFQGSGHVYKNMNYNITGPTLWLGSYSAASDIDSLGNGTYTVNYLQFGSGTASSINHLQGAQIYLGVNGFADYDCNTTYGETSTIFSSVGTNYFSNNALTNYHKIIGMGNSSGINTILHVDTLIIRPAGVIYSVAAADSVYCISLLDSSTLSMPIKTPYVISGRLYRGYGGFTYEAGGKFLTTSATSDATIQPLNGITGDTIRFNSVSGFAYSSTWTAKINNVSVTTISYDAQSETGWFLIPSGSRIGQDTLKLYSDVLDTVKKLIDIDTAYYVDLSLPPDTPLVQRNGTQSDPFNNYLFVYAVGNPPVTNASRYYNNAWHIVRSNLKFCLKGSFDNSSLYPWQLKTYYAQTYQPWNLAVNGPWRIYGCCPQEGTFKYGMLFQECAEWFTFGPRISAYSCLFSVAGNGGTLSWDAGFVYTSDTANYSPAKFFGCTFRAMRNDIGEIAYFYDCVWNGNKHYESYNAWNDFQNSGKIVAKNCVFQQSKALMQVDYSGSHYTVYDTNCQFSWADSGWQTDLPLRDTGSSVDSAQLAWYAPRDSFNARKLLSHVTNPPLAGTYPYTGYEYDLWGNPRHVIGANWYDANHYVTGSLKAGAPFLSIDTVIGVTTITIDTVISVTRWAYQVPCDVIVDLPGGSWTFPGPLNTGTGDVTISAGKVTLGKMNTTDLTINNIGDSVIVTDTGIINGPYSYAPGVKFKFIPPGTFLTSFTYPGSPQAHDTVGHAITPLTTGILGNPDSFVVIGTPLPSGITINKTTGTISGTPLVASGATSYTIRAYGSNHQDSSSTTVSITVYAAASPSKHHRHGFSLGLGMGLFTGN